MKRLTPLLQFFPLSVFLLLIREGGVGEKPWAFAFQIAGGLAVLQTLFFSRGKAVLNRLLLGANLFLAIGGLGFGLNLEGLISIYGKMMTAAVFACVIFVGLVTTLGTRAGFIERPDLQRWRVAVFSFWLLAISCLAGLMSTLWSHDLFWGGTVPFLILILARSYLRRRAGPPRSRSH